MLRGKNANGSTRYFDETMKMIIVVLTQKLI